MKKNLIYSRNPDGTIDQEARDNVKKEIEKISCKSPIWLSNSAILFAQVSIFLILVKKIDKQTKMQIEDDRIRYGLLFNDSRFLERLKKLKNLWFINLTFLALTFYALLHSIISLIWANNVEGQLRTCNLITNNPKIDSILWIVIQLVNMLLWQYPLFIIFWPAKVPTSQIHQTSFKKQSSL